MKTEQPHKVTPTVKVDPPKRKPICTNQEIMYFVGGSILYVIIFIPIVYLTTLLPDYDTGSELYRDIFSRDNYYTTVFSTGKFALWMILMITGFAFVNIFNLQNERKSPFKSRNGTFKDIKILVLAGVILYFTAPIIALRSRHDMQRNINLDGEETSYSVEFSNNSSCKGSMT